MNREYLDQEILSKLNELERLVLKWCQLNPTRNWMEQESYEEKTVDAVIMDIAHHLKFEHCFECNYWFLSRDIMTYYDHSEQYCKECDKKIYGNKTT